MGRGQESGPEHEVHAWRRRAPRTPDCRASGTVARRLHRALRHHGRCGRGFHFEGADRVRGGIRPFRNGLVSSLSHPGRNVTGFSADSVELGRKGLSLPKEAVPGLRVVGVLVGIRNHLKIESLDEAERHLGLSLVQFELSRPPQPCYCVPHG